MRVVVTGSSGLIGRELVTALVAEGHDVTKLVRRTPEIGEAVWDPVAGTIDAGALDGADAIVHLAGAGIGDRRWSPARRAVLISSRVSSTELIARTVAGLARPPAMFVSASAIGVYGNRGDELLVEDSPPGDGFLARLCIEWERATVPAERVGVRVVHLRSALVLARNGGALGRTLPLFHAGLGGVLGDGRQWWSWISLRDEVGAIQFVLTHAEIAGPVNACAPHPATNREFTRALGRQLHRPTAARVPRFALRAVLGRELADEVPLGSQRVIPQRLVAAGYPFAHPQLADALAWVFDR